MRRLGLDIGTNSIGWCLIEDDIRIVDIGVRIFSDGRDPKSGASLAVDRRAARAMRRRRDRYLRRRSAFLENLIRYGLMSADTDEAKLLAARDPYDLRARALTERLEPGEIGRALFHLNQRRGFLSNRKAERGQKDSEDGKIASGATKLRQEMAAAGVSTLGQFLDRREEKRVRLNSDLQSYDFYPQRQEIIDEFIEIWDAQAKYHPDLMTRSILDWDELARAVVARRDDYKPIKARDALYRILFFQRPLKAAKVGVCLFAGRGGVPADEPRLAKAHPLFQERRLYEEVNHLAITAPGRAPRPLTRDQRDHLILALRKKRKMGYASLAKLLKLQPAESFNKASATRTEMLGDEVYAALAAPKSFDAAWVHFSSERQWTIISRLLDEEDPDVLHAFLTKECGLDDEHAIFTAKVHLPEGYGRLGETATRRILDELKLDVIPYSKAVERAGWHHSDERRDDGLDRLPYYGELLSREIPPGTFDPADTDDVERYWGKITNPTVHIGLRQLQKVVNAVIDVHGRPDEIVVELARELKLNEKDKEEHNRRIRKDTADAQRRSRLLLGQDADGNQTGDGLAPDTGANRALLKLWEELAPSSFLDRCCPYCGKPINISTLFSAAVQVDHILPYSKTLDDSPANKVVAHRACNQQKANRHPYKAWSADPERWIEITAQVKHLHRSKQWRFGPDAMERFEAEGGFVARQLTDTQYLSRLAGSYLQGLYAKDEGRKVYVVPGRMTAMLRRLWALNDVLDDSKIVDNKNSNASKNRLDHRHHAIDAFVSAVTTASLLQRIADAAGRAESKDLDKMFEGLPEPWPGYLGELRERLARVTTSHKADHGRTGRPSRTRDVTAGRLHNDTAYGFTGDVAPDGRTPIVVHRVPLASLKPADFTNPQRIPDAALRDALFEATRGLSGKDYDAALQRFAKAHPQFGGIRRVRVREPLNVIPIRDKTGKAYKGYKGDANARFDVWRLPTGKCVADIVSMFDAHAPAGTDRRPHPAAKKVLSLRQNDMLAIGEGADRRMVRVVKFSTIGVIALAAANEAGALKARDATPNDVDPFKYILSSANGLMKLKARQVRIDPLGRILDPGPR